MKKIANMIRDVRDMAVKQGGMGAQVAPQKPRGGGFSEVVNKVREVAGQSPRSRGGFSGMMDKVRSAVQAKKKPFKSGGSVKSKASSRGDGCATKGKTKGRMI